MQVLWLVSDQIKPIACIFTLASSSSFRRREMTMRTRLGTFLTPLLQTALFSLTSRRTSVVPIIFLAKARICLTAWGAFSLKDLPWTALWMLTVYSRLTTSLERLSFFTISARGVPGMRTSGGGKKPSMGEHAQYEGDHRHRNSGAPTMLPPTKNPFTRYGNALKQG